MASGLGRTASSDHLYWTAAVDLRGWDAGFCLHDLGDGLVSRSRIWHRREDHRLHLPLCRRAFIRHAEPAARAYRRPDRGDLGHADRDHAPRSRPRSLSAPPQLVDSGDRYSAGAGWYGLAVPGNHVSDVTGIGPP